MPNFSVPLSHRAFVLKILASLRPSAFALNSSFCSFSGSLPRIRRTGNANCAAADLAEPTAALAATAEHSAMQKCQFGGLLPHSRLPFRRE
ncbi:MAG: hypothetical protein H0X30_15585 [Anaerolineae bacterium]|nr:hypothetical protein [Anaerolineae bacterium]